MFGCRGPFPREDELPLRDDLAQFASALVSQAIEGLEYDAEPSTGTRISLGAKQYVQMLHEPADFYPGLLHHALAKRQCFSFAPL
jgi:hypothetical protein